MASQEAFSCKEVATAVRRIASVIGLAGLLCIAGCAQLSEGSRASTTASAQPIDYGPNPLADCLRWPKDAPHIEPLYAP